MQKTPLLAIYELPVLIVRSVILASSPQHTYEHNRKQNLNTQSDCVKIYPLLFLGVQTLGLIYPSLLKLCVKVFIVQTKNICQIYKSLGKR